jgi:hypothetical protein
VIEKDFLFCYRQSTILENNSSDLVHIQKAKTSL